MQELLSFSEFRILFPDDRSCLEEIRRLRYPKGIYCRNCGAYTMHYQVKGRTSFACTLCRTHVYPLAGTVFARSSTPLRLWFYSIYLMTQTRGKLSAKQLQREIGVTYKTAWRITHTLYQLMELHNGDLLLDTESADNRVHKWVFFNTIEIRVAQKKEQREK